MSKAFWFSFELKDQSIRTKKLNVYFPVQKNIIYIYLHRNDYKKRAGRTL